MSEHERSPDDDGIPELEEEFARKRHLAEDDEIPVRPADTPLAAFDRVTAAEQRRGETIRTRVAREVPDVLPERPDDRLGHKIYEETDEDGTDIFKELVADEDDDSAGLSPEEAAMHIVDPDDDQEL